jgi:hypothetical protein
MTGMQALLFGELVSCIGIRGRDFNHLDQREVREDNTSIIRICMVGDSGCQPLPPYAEPPYAKRHVRLVIDEGQRAVIGGNEPAVCF